MKKAISPKKTITIGNPASLRKKASQVNRELILSASGKANRYFVLFFFLFSLLLYGNTLLNRFAADDQIVTNNAVVVRGVQAIPQIFLPYKISQQESRGFATVDFKPIAKATFALEYQLWGNKPGLSHAVNLLLYWALSVLLFFILKRLLCNYNILFPVLVTFLFMAHPVHTEVVASLKNRGEMLAFICGLANIWFILDYAGTAKIRYLVWAMLFVFLGYFSAFSIWPFLVLSPIVLYFFTNLPGKKVLIVQAVLLTVILAAKFGSQQFLPHAESTPSFIENPLFTEANFWLHFGTGFASLLFYLRILIYPSPLVYYYGFNMIPVSNLANIWVILSLCIHVAFFVYAIRSFQEKRLLSFAIVWYIVSISVYSNILFPVTGIVSERFVFIASLGFCIAIMIFIFKIFGVDPKSLTIEIDSRLKILALVILIMIPYSVLTIARNRDWRSAAALYQNDINSLKKSAKANIDYAGYLANIVYTDENYQKSGVVERVKYQEIITQYRRALAIYPVNCQTNFDLGTAYLLMGKNWDSAAWYLRKSVALDSTLQPAWVNLGIVCREQNKYTEAIECFENALKVDPDVETCIQLNKLYLFTGDTTKADYYTRLRVGLEKKEHKATVE